MEVLRLTNGKGVDVILETVGGSSIKQSVACATTRGFISWIGFLGGWEREGFVNALGDLFLKAVTLQSVSPPRPYSVVIYDTNISTIDQYRSALSLIKEISAGFWRRRRFH